MVADVRRGIGQYHQYTQNQSVLAALFGVIVGRILEAVERLGLCALRVAGAAEARCQCGIRTGLGLVLALTVVIVPMSAPYNQVLLAPAILALLRSESSGDPILPAIRRARAVGYFLLVWPWIATIGLSLAYIWLTPELRQRLWPMPLYSSFMVPVFVFGLALLDTWRSEPRRLRDERDRRVVCCGSDIAA